mgnify:FL=1
MIRKRSLFLPALAAVALMVGGTSAMAGTIDFEDAADFGLGDDDPVASEFTPVTFSLETANGL